MLLDIPKAWKSCFVHLFSITKNQEIVPADGVRIYGGSFLPTGILFLKKTYKHPIGKALLDQDQCELITKMKDFEYLKSLPDGTLGKEYYKFYQTNLMYAEGDFRDYLDMDKKRPNRPFSDKQYNTMKIVNRFFEQISYQHDLMHVLGGFAFTIEGEALVHSFLIPHIRLPAPKLIAIFLGIDQSIKKRKFSIITKMWKSFQNGKKAKWLFPVDWVQYLDKDIGDIREEFKIFIL